MPLQTLIIDDERRSRESLQNLLTRYCTGVEIIGSANGVEKGEACIRELRPDLIFLDIQMQDGTGFDLLHKSFDQPFQVIFTTAFDNYAVQAFKFSAIDYLLKPIDIDELNRAVERARQVKEEAETNSQLQELLSQVAKFDRNDPTITISTEHSYEFLKVMEVLRVEADGAYSRFFMRSGKQYLTSRLLKEFETLLSDYGFFRIHQSHLINMREIERFVKADSHIELRDGTQVPVSRRRKEAFVRRFVKS